MDTSDSNFEFHFEEVESFPLFSNIEKWLSLPFEDCDKEIDKIDFIICDDEYLLNINKTHLDHDYYTDIITFPLSENPIEANVFISIDRVKENAQLYKVKLEDELHRVMIHGMLHLCGYGDKTETEIQTMRDKEDHYLALRPI